MTPTNSVRPYIIKGYYAPQSLGDDKYVLVLLLPTGIGKDGKYTNSLAKEYRCTGRSFFEENMGPSWGSMTIGDDLSGMLPRSFVLEIEEIIARAYRYKADSFATEAEMVDAKEMILDTLQKIIAANTKPCNVIFDDIIYPN